MAISNVRDALWLRDSFVVSSAAYTDADIAQRALTRASLKFTDTTMGGNFVLNPPPQFTRYADVNASVGTRTVWSPAFGRLTELDPEIGDTRVMKSGSRGMGRRYSEMLDDNGQIITMRFGVPQYNAFTNFFGNFYSLSISLIGRTGRGPNLIFQAFRLAGQGLALPWMPMVLGGRALRRLSGVPASKFYYMKPTMHTYWNAASTILNAIAVNLGIVPGLGAKGQANIEDSPNNTWTEAELKKYHELIPDIIAEDGTIDIRGISNRAQRLSHAWNVKVRQKLDAVEAQGINQRSSEEAYYAALNDLGREALINETSLRDPGTIGSLADYVKAYLSLTGNEAETTDTGVNSEQVEKAVDPTAEEGTILSRKQYDAVSGGGGFLDKVTGWGSTFWEMFRAELSDGSAWVSFRVDYTPTQSETFSTSTRPHELAGQVNAMAQQNRMTRINFADGNLIGGLVGKAAAVAIDGVKSAIGGLLEGVSMGGLLAFAGNALVEVPNVIGDSTAQLPRLDCQMALRSIYGNRLSQLINIHVPLACIMAGALPISHGRHAYGTPFLCEAYMQGRAAIRLGVIDNLTITRGTGNVGWSYDREALGIDVSFSIQDMSTILHMPIIAGMETLSDNLVMGAAGLADAVLGTGDQAKEYGSALTSGAYDEDSAFTDYMGVLGSLTHGDLIYNTRRWYLNRARVVRNWKDQTSPTRVAQGLVHGNSIFRLINAAVMPDAARLR